MYFDTRFYTYQTTVKYRNLKHNLMQSKTITIDEVQIYMFSIGHHGLFLDVPKLY